MPLALESTTLHRNLYEETNPGEAISLALEHLEAMTYHVGEALTEMASDEDETSRQCYALSLMLEAMQYKHTFIREKVDEWRGPASGPTRPRTVVPRRPRRRLRMP